MSVMAAFSGRSGIRFAELQSAIPASRQPLRDALTALVSMGWIARHGGHGHPLRPEYLLTRQGEALALAAKNLQAVLDRSASADLLLRKWSLPVLAALLGGADRFNAIRADLTDGEVRPTPRALALALADLEEAGLVQREVEPGKPPSTRYKPMVPAGLRRALEALLAALES
ncbi:MAG: winged helix-turn-helix transcriptional regulator [Candidatus Eisenbacteria bacterium]